MPCRASGRPHKGQMCNVEKCHKGHLSTAMVTAAPQEAATRKVTLVGVWHGHSYGGIYGGLMMVNDSSWWFIVIHNDMGVFHSHGGIPIAGWLISWKIPSRNGWWLGVALFQETTICWMLLVRVFDVCKCSNQWLGVPISLLYPNDIRIFQWLAKDLVVTNKIRTEHAKNYFMKEQ